MGASSSKIEYPPLLNLGRWVLSLDELRFACVDGFPKSQTREGIMCCLEHIVAVLLAAGIKGDLWVDGSFLTRKVDPEDADLVLCIDGDDADSMTLDQQDVADWFVDSDGHLHRWLHCHCFAFARYKPGHCLHWESEYDYVYWMKQWGWSRGGERKGIAVVELR